MTEQSKNGWVTPSAQNADLTLAVDDNEIVLVFTNSRSSRQITITKTWDDENDQDGKRPETDEFTVTLTDEKNSENSHTANSWTVSEEDANVWTATVTVPAYTDAGAEITYKAVSYTHLDVYKRQD